MFVFFCNSKEFCVQTKRNQVPKEDLVQWS